MHIFVGKTKKEIMHILVRRMEYNFNHHEIIEKLKCYTLFEFQNYGID